MAVAIIGLLSTVFGVVWYLWKRKLDHVETPAEIIAQNHASTETEIARDDEDRANARVDDLLLQLRARQNNSRRQSPPPR